MKDVELEVRFKLDFKPVFCKPHTVPFALLEDLNQAYDKGIKKGMWVPTPFNKYGAPVLPICKALQPGDERTKLRVCGDYSVTVNPHLEMHRHPLPLPEDLVVDLAYAYNQIQLAPKSQKQLALSTHCGVLLQT